MTFCGEELPDSAEEFIKMMQLILYDEGAAMAIGALEQWTAEKFCLLPPPSPTGASNRTVYRDWKC